MARRYIHVLIGDLQRTIYSTPVLTQTEVAEALDTTRFVIGYRLRGQNELARTLKNRTIEAMRARKSRKPLYIVRAKGDEYCTPSLRELGELMYAYREVNGGILNVHIQRRAFSTLPKINSFKN